MSTSICKIVLIVTLFTGISLAADQWQSYFIDTTNGDELDENEVLLYDSQRDRIWTESHYIDLSTDTVVEYATKGFGSPTLLSLDSSGTIWQSGVWSGVKSYDGTSVTKHSWDTANAGIAQVISDTKGHYWYTLGFGTGTFTFDGTKHTRISSFDPQVIRKDSNGEIWLADHNKVKHYTDSGWDDYDIPSIGVSEFGVDDIAIGKEGTIWIATNAYPPDSDSLGGLLRRSPEGNWTHFTTKDGLPHVDLRSLTLDSSGNIWIGSCAGLTYYDGKSFQTWNATDWGIDTTDLYEGNAVHDITIDSLGRVWIGSRGVHCLTPDLSVASLSDVSIRQSSVNIKTTLLGRRLYFQTNQTIYNALSLTLTSIQGKTITHKKSTITNGATEMLELPESLASGIYIFKIHSNEIDCSQRIIIP